MSRLSTTALTQYHRATDADGYALRHGSTSSTTRPIATVTPLSGSARPMVRIGATIASCLSRPLRRCSRRICRKICSGPRFACRTQQCPYIVGFGCVRHVKDV
jgi:hypothetical protein